jgi:hypothetical protein
MREIFALSPDEDELHHFRCTHAERTGQLPLTLTLTLTLPRTRT